MLLSKTPWPDAVDTRETAGHVTDHLDRRQSTVTDRPAGQQVSTSSVTSRAADDVILPVTPVRPAYRCPLAGKRPIHRARRTAMSSWSVCLSVGLSLTR